MIGLPSIAPELRHYLVDVNAEIAALSAAMVSRTAAKKVVSALVAEDFYFQGHQAIYEGIQALLAEDTTPDAITLASRLQQRGQLEMVGGIEGLRRIEGTLHTSAMVDHYMGPIADKSMRRALLEDANALIASLHENEEPAEIIAEDYAMVLQAKASSKAVCLGHSAKEAFSRRKNQILNREVQPIIKLNQPDLDAILTIHPGDLIVVSGILNTGKSATLMNWLLSACESGVQSELWTLEMMEDEYLDRMIAAKSAVGATKITKGELSDTDMEFTASWAEWLEDLPLRIYDDIPHVEALRGQLRMNAVKFGTKLVFVDQLEQLDTRAKHDNDVLKLGYIATQLKKSARENGNAVVLLHQLNRAGDDTGRPEIKHVRGSGKIAEACDALVLLYQPERKKEHAKAAYQDEVRLDWIIPRQRNGPKGVVKRTFKLSTQQIYIRGDEHDEPEQPAKERRHWE
jgi:replicative DNA helicase